MKLIKDGRSLTVVLSRRNLLSLLSKLYGHPPGSSCTIWTEDSDPLALFRWVKVKAEPDEIHYQDHKPGPMHPSTELDLARK